MVFGFSFYPSPHASAALSTIGSCSRDVAKRHFWIQFYQRLGGAKRELVGYAMIVPLAHACGRYTQTVKASIVATQHILNFRVIEKIVMDDFAQFFVLEFARTSPEDQYGCYLGMI